MPKCRCLGSLLLLAGGAGATTSSPPPEQITVDRAVEARLPHPAELETAERVATAARLLAGASGVLLRGATLSAAAGPRRSADAEESTDVAVAIDLPLLFASAEQRSLAAALESAAPVLTQASRAIAQLEVEQAYLVAWRDAEELALRERELVLVDAWLEGIRQRVQAGAEPPFRITVAVGERERVAAGRNEARVRALASRLTLAGLSSLPAGELKWSAPDLDEDEAADRGAEIGLLRLAAELGAELELAVAALDSKADTTRWTLTSDIASEGKDEVARVGVAYRIAPRRERGAASAQLAAVRDSLRRRSDLEVAALEARAAAALRTLAAEPPALSEEDVEGALRALTALVTEGKERPTDVLAERRTLVEARVALLERRFARAAASAELRILTRRFEP